MSDSFLWGLSGRVVTPHDVSYGVDRQGFNRAVQHYPLIINYCRTPYDVANAVKWARQNDVEIRIRNGGHNYEGYSNGNGVLVIDVSEMTGIELSEPKNTVRVQGGVTNGQLYAFLAPRGYPFPGGTCPTVGVCGYALGGGWGLSSRAFGLGCDSIVEIELINDEGRILRANSTINSDLFWALRGAGGGNFGVVTSVTFKLPPQVENVTLVEIDYLHIDQKAQEQFLQTWQQWLRQADNRMTLIGRIYNSEADGFAALVRGIFYGEPVEASQSIYDFLYIPGAVSNIEYMPFLEAVNIIGSAYPEFEKFKSASRFVYRDFSPQEISDIVGLVQERPEGSVFAGLSLYALGGRVAEVGVDETAFFYRAARYILWIESIFEENCFADASAEWVSRRYRYLEPLTCGSYVNFPYAGLRDYKREYFGGHVKYLRWIKQKYDPCNVFTYPQGLERGGFYAPHPLAPEPVSSGEEVSAQLAKESANPRHFRYVTPQG